MPSWKRTPRTTSGKRLKPPSLRQLCSAIGAHWNIKPSKVFWDTQFLGSVRK